MRKPLSLLAITGAVLFPASLSAAQAQDLSSQNSIVSFVSGKGFDSGTCASPARPCRTFQFALDHIGAGGEVKALDPADYGRVTITKPISITGVDGAGINLSSANAITINAGVADVVNLTNLTLDGIGKATNGIALSSAGSLSIIHCAVRNFVTGIALQPGGTLKFLIADTVVLDNRGDGIDVAAQGNGVAHGIVERVLANKNSRTGIALLQGADVTVVDSVANNNSFSGFQVTGDTGALRIAHSTATQNAIGVLVGTLFVQAVSFGDNHINGNTTDISPPGNLIKVGTQ
jgi:Right handed beta helix region